MSCAAFLSTICLQVLTILPFVDKNGSRARGDAEARQFEVVRGAAVRGGGG